MRFFPLLSGILLGLTWVPALPPVFIAFGFVPLWYYWIKKPRIFTVVGSGLLAATVGVLIACPWVGVTARGYWPISWASASAITFLFSSVAYVYLPATGLLWLLTTRKLKLTEWRSLLLLPLLQALLESSFPFFLHTHFGYPWLWSGLPIIQLADWVGMAGLSLVVYFLNFAILVSILKWRSDAQKQAITVLSVAAAFFLSINLIGYWHGKSWATGDRSINVLLIQPNSLPPDIARARLGELYTFQNLYLLIELTREAVKNFGKPELIIWPENAVPVDMNAKLPENEKIRNFAIEMGVPLVLGSSVVDSEKKRFSAMVAINANGTIAGVHKKSVLMPFGEYIPGADFFPSFNQVSRHRSQLSAGDAQSVINVAGVRLGGGICYEGILSRTGRGLADQNAELIVNITNDYWFGDTAAPWQHMNMTLARAIEYRRPLIRVANSGISSVMAADGTRLVESNLYTPWSAMINVPYQLRPTATPYQKFGTYLPLLLLSIIFFILFARKKPARPTALLIFLLLIIFVPKKAFAEQEVACSSPALISDYSWEGQVKLNRNLLVANTTPSADLAILKEAVAEQLKFWSSRYPYRYLSRSIQGLSVNRSKLEVKLLRKEKTTYGKNFPVKPLNNSVFTEWPKYTQQAFKAQKVHKQDSAYFFHYQATVPIIVCAQTELLEDKILLPLPIDPFLIYWSILPEQKRPFKNGQSEILANPCSTQPLVTEAAPNLFPERWNPYRIQLDAYQNFFDCEALMRESVFVTQLKSNATVDKKSKISKNKNLGDLLQKVDWEKVWNNKRFLRATIIIPPANLANLSKDMQSAQNEFKKLLESNVAETNSEENFNGVSDWGGRLQLRLLRSITQNFSPTKKSISLNSEGLELIFETKNSRTIRIIWAADLKTAIDQLYLSLNQDAVTVFASGEITSTHLIPKQSFNNLKSIVLTQNQLFALLTPHGVENPLFAGLLGNNNSANRFSSSVLTNLGDYSFSDAPIMEILRAFSRSEKKLPDVKNSLTAFFSPRPDFPKRADEFFWVLQTMGKE